ncbi:MAG: DUF3108 domain-containing protein [Thermoanaerobaculia bacterium]
MRKASIILVLIAWLAVPAMASPRASEPAAPAGAAAGDSGEVLHYEWKLKGALSAIAALFLPDRGSGTLTTGNGEDGRVVTELRIESETNRSGEFWEYGAQIEPVEGDTELVWSAYRWRGEESSKREELDDGIIDVVSGIWTLRQAPPDAPRRMEIWSDGKLYPVLVQPGGSEQHLVCGETRTARHVTVRGVRVPDRRFWKGSLELWLADDPAATPTRIVLDRGWARVRLDLTGRSTADGETGC